MAAKKQFLSQQQNPMEFILKIVKRRTQYETTWMPLNFGSFGFGFARHKWFTAGNWKKNEIFLGLTGYTDIALSTILIFLGSFEKKKGN